MARSRVARFLDGGKEPFDVGLLGDAGQLLAPLDKVTLGDDGVGRRIVEFEVEKDVEGTQGGELAVDGAGRVAQDVLAVGDVGVDVADGDGGDGLVGPVEEELEIADIVDAGAGVGAPALEPLVEPSIKNKDA